MAGKKLIASDINLLILYSNQPIDVRRVGYMVICEGTNHTGPLIDIVTRPMLALAISMTAVFIISHDHWDYLTIV